MLRQFPHSYRTIFPFSLCLITIISAVLLIGCGSGGGGGKDDPDPVITVSITPGSAQLIPAQTLPFSATVSGTNNQQVVWSITEGLAGGSINENGFYTAPGLAGTYHVVATSKADLTKNAIASVTVHITVDVNPATESVTLREARQLNATITGAINQNVTWSVQEGNAGGSVSSTGLYTAPATPGTYHVIATSQVDPQRSATVTINVLSGAASGVIE